MLRIYPSASVFDVATPVEMVTLLGANINHVFQQLDFLAYPIHVPGSLQRSQAY
jgi:hypothetical protein